MFQRRNVMQYGRSVVTHASQNSAMPSCRDVSARPRIDLHDFAGGKEALLLQHDHASPVAALLVSPNPGRNVFDGIGDVLGTVMADFALRSLRGVPANRYSRVDQEIEPVGNLFDLRTALGIDGAIILLAVENPPCGIPEPRERGSRRRPAHMIRP